MSSITGRYVGYKIIQLLSKDFEDWDAYKLGIIDKDGKTIKSPDTREEKASFDMFQIIIRNLKLLLAKFPFGRSRIASFAAALLLIKESKGLTDDSLDSILVEYLNIDISETLLNESTDVTLHSGIYEDVLGNKYHIKGNDCIPYKTYFNETIYRVTDISSNETTLITASLLTRL